MKARFQAILSFIKQRPYLAGLPILAVVILFVFSSRGTGKEHTLTVHPGEFVQTVSVSGTVTAEHAVDLGFTQSGRISGVYAHVGDVVSAGTLLANVENGELRASVLQSQAALETQQAKLESLKQGTRPEEIAVTQSSIISDQNSLAQANDAVVNAIRAAYTTVDDAVKNKSDQFFDNPRTSPSLKFSVSDSSLRGRTESERSGMQQTLALWGASVASISPASNILSAANEAAAALSSAMTFLSDANASLNLGITNAQASQSTINGWIVDMGVARSAVNTASTNLTAAITAQRNAVAALDRDQKTLALQRAGTTQADIDAQKAQVKAAAANVAEAQAQLAKTLITAPFSGTVTRMDAKVGEIVSPNTSKISMVGNGVYQIESYVPEINVALISPGNTAVVTLDAYGQSTPFYATVISVDPAQTVRDGVSTYRTLLVFSGKDDRIKLGMTANTVITAQKRDGVISVPQNLVIERDGKSYVPTAVNGKKVEREVTVGAVSSLGNIEITSGLSDGDVVILPTN